MSRSHRGTGGICVHPEQDARPSQVHSEGNNHPHSCRTHTGCIRACIHPRSNLLDVYITVLRRRLSKLKASPLQLQMHHLFTPIWGTGPVYPSQSALSQDALWANQNLFILLAMADEVRGMVREKYWFKEKSATRIVFYKLPTLVFSIIFVTNLHNFQVGQVLQRMQPMKFGHSLRVTLKILCLDCERKPK